MANGHTRMFLKQLFTNPYRTGAVAPSSNALANRMAELAAPGPGAVIAEFGPGTGVFTRRILAALRPDQRFFAIEINRDFATELRRQFPGLHLYDGDASDVAEYARREGVDHVDCVVSGLPWAVFPDELQRRILGNMTELMPVGGVFVTFAYLQGLAMPAGIKFRKNLKDFFSLVESSGVVWRNVPPAIIYRCRK